PAALLVIGQSGTRRHESTHDDVLLQPTKMITRSAHGSLGQNPRGLLEGCSGNERFRRQAGLGNAQKLTLELRRLFAFGLGATVFFDNRLILHLLALEKLRVSRSLDLHTTQHLAD